MNVDLSTVPYSWVPLAICIVGFVVLLATPIVLVILDTISKRRGW